MKKLLIVTRNPIDTEHAKTFFAAIPDIECIYCNTKKAAEALLPTATMLITDVHLPYDDSDTLSQYPGYREKLLGAFELEFTVLTENEITDAALGMNGLSLIILAKTQGIPHLAIGLYGTFKRADCMTFHKADLPHQELRDLVQGDNRTQWALFRDEFDKYWNRSEQFACWYQRWTDGNTDFNHIDWQAVWNEIQKQS